MRRSSQESKSKPKIRLKFRITLSRNLSFDKSRLTRTIFFKKEKEKKRTMNNYFEYYYYRDSSIGCPLKTHNLKKKKKSNISNTLFVANELRILSASIVPRDDGSPLLEVVEPFIYR